MAEQRGTSQRETWREWCALGAPGSDPWRQLRAGHGPGPARDHLPDPELVTREALLLKRKCQNSVLGRYNRSHSSEKWGTARRIGPSRRPERVRWTAIYRPGGESLTSHGSVDWVLTLPTS